MTAKVELHGVSKTYYTEGIPVSALMDISLEVPAGEFIVLAGPSGSGKSTLLHLIGALDRPTEGKIIVADQDLQKLSKNKLAEFRLRKIGFIFQAYNLIPVLTALENVEYLLLLQKATKRERGQRAVDILKRVGLSDQLNKRPTEMSGGQQQRVAVARALATRPEIVLADEPTANLDSATGANLIDLFRELNEEFKTTFIIATHDPMVIERAHSVVNLHDGKVVSV